MHLFSPKYFNLACVPTLFIDFDSRSALIPYFPWKVYNLQSLNIKDIKHKRGIYPEVDQLLLCSSIQNSSPMALIRSRSRTVADGSSIHLVHVGVYKLVSGSW